jgi:hypothetical protein
MPNRNRATIGQKDLKRLEWPRLMHRFQLFDDHTEILLRPIPPNNKTATNGRGFENRLLIPGPWPATAHGVCLLLRTATNGRG